MTRKDTKVINIGGRKIGGGNPVAIQSMTNTKTEDVEATVAQILALEKAGCDVTLLSIENADHADIHFFRYGMRFVLSLRQSCKQRKRGLLFFRKAILSPLPRSAVEGT